MSTFQPYKIKIKDFIKSISTGKYQLPCFQRDFKWNPSKIKSLINSIQHEYPAGSLLFLKVDGDKPLIPNKEFSYANKEKFTEKPEMLVLDGQQRMTSCFSVFMNLGSHTYYIDYLELMNKYKSGETDFDFETLIVHKRHNNSPFTEIPKGLFPLSFLKDRDTMRNQIKIYVKGARSDSSKTEICDFLSYDFDGIISSILDYEFPVVELPINSSMESVCKVFQTINTTGLKLSVFDICVAVFMPQNINLKELVNKASDSTNYVKTLLAKDPTSVLQVIALLANKSPNANSLPKELESQDITDYWDDAIDGIENTLDIFDDYGAGTKKNLSILPYTPLVTIVAAVLARTKFKSMNSEKQAIVKKKLKKYFFTTALAARYTEGTNAKINEDFKVLNQWISNDKMPAMIQRGVDWNTNGIIGYKKNSAFGKAILCVLNSCKPKDFYDDRQVGIGETIKPCDLHHIFPKATYETSNAEMINSVFNITWLIKDTNIRIKDRRTNEYMTNIINNIGLSENEIKAKLKCHVINADSYNALFDEDYTTFIQNRANEYKKRFADIGVVFREVGEDEVDIEVEDDDSDDEIE